MNKFACSWTSLSSSISFGAALLLRNVESWGARWYHIRCYFPTDSWLGRRWGAVVSTTKCSEQNHKFKEKELRGHPNSKIQSQDLLLWNRFQNRHHVRAGFAAYRRGRLGISPPAHYDWLWAAAQSGHARALPIPNFAKNVSSWGATRQDRASSAATVEHPPRLFMT